MDGNHLLQMKFSDSDVSGLVRLSQDLHMVGDTRSTPAGDFVFESDDLNSRNNTCEVAPLHTNLQSILGFMSARPCFGNDRIDEFACPGTGDDQLGRIPELPPYQECDPRVLFNNLVFLEQKVHDLEGVIKAMIQERSNPDQTTRDASFSTRQQMVVTEIGSIISQAISTAGKLLHLSKVGVQGSLCIDKIYPVISHLSDLLGGPLELGARDLQKVGIQGSVMETNMGVGNHSAKEDGGNYDNQVEKPVLTVPEVKPDSAAYLDLSGVLKDKNEDGEDRDLTFPGYEILELEKEEILAPHTHFCLICDKGFKRDANLRMHMRGHGEIFKTPEALTNPNKEAKLDFVRPRRYSCPFDGCKRNQKHKKFQPLKTILCVKNHYKRSHCSKSYICSRCNSKKFSVIADLKTHEKHCGKDKWLCSCGTTFSRKDKLLGHVALFHGHTPILPVQENNGCRIVDETNKTERKKTNASKGLNPLKANIVEFDASVVGKQAAVPGSSSSADLRSLAGNDQPILTNTHFLVEENKVNLHTDCLETPQSPFTFMGGPFSFESLLQYGFIEPDGENSSSDGV